MTSIRILCLDTSTQAARVAIVDGAGVAIARAEATADRHSPHVLKLCDEVLVAAGLTPAGLDAIACGAGPGSFTGLRVGLSVAKGLALATGKPLLLLSSLQALALDLARAAPEARVVVPCIDAGKGEVYAFDCAVNGGVVAVGGEPWRLAPAALAERLAELAGASAVA
ncbi:MAG: peptidase glycoprotease, partial [Myxococcales bacterium]|nr:peptidase glycoprotease [Myxococcales bacterium]